LIFNFFSDTSVFVHFVDEATWDGLSFAVETNRDSGLSRAKKTTVRVNHAEVVALNKIKID
jgi:hypothetical protein